MKITFLFLWAAFSTLQQDTDLAEIDSLIGVGSYKQAIVLSNASLSDAELNKKGLLHARKGDAFYYLYEQDSSLSNYLKAVRYLEENRYYPAKLYEVYDYIGGMYASLGNPEKAKDFYKKALNQAISLGDSSNLAAAYFNLSTAFIGNGNLSEGFDLLLKAYEIDVEMQDSSAISYDLNAMGFAAIEMGEPNRAIGYFKESISMLAAQEQSRTLGIRYNNLSQAFGKAGNLDSALIYNKRSSDIHEATADSSSLNKRWINRCILLSDMGKQFEGLPYGRAAKKYFSKKGNIPLVISANQAIIRSLKGLGRLEESILLASQNIKMSAKGSSARLHETALHDYADISNSLRRYKDAYQYKMQAITLGDSIRSSEVVSQLAMLQAKYETAKKEAEIERLSLENELQHANLGRSRNAQLAIGIGASLTIVLLIVFFTLRHRKEKAEKEAQVLQIDALKKRFMELHSSPSELAVQLDFEELNSKLNTPLTEREFDAFKLSIEGKTNIEIGEALFISVSTVKFHLRNTYAKMGVGNRKEAFRYMLKTS